MTSTRAQTGAGDKPHTVPSEEVGRGPGADPEGEAPDEDDNRPDEESGGRAVVPDEEKPDHGHDIADEAGPLQTEFGTKKAAESMMSKKFKGD
jgi:hypothetical protein